MPRYEVPLNGAGPYYLVLYTSQSGRNVSATLMWRRDAYGFSSNSGGASWSLNIAGVPFGGGYSFNAPAGGAIGETYIGGASQYVSSGDLVGIVGSFNSDVSPGSASIYGQENLTPPPPPATRPGKPSMLEPDQVTQTSMRVRYLDGATGGAAITSRALQYSLTPDFSSQNSPLIGVGISGFYASSGHAIGTRYYWRYRTQNAVGVSDWSDIVSAMTLGGGRRKVGGSWVNIVRWVKVAGAWKKTRRWVKVAGVWRLTR